MNILSLLDSNGFIKLNKSLTHYLGLHTTIFLAEIISEHEYWRKMNRLDEQGFFYSTVENVWEETGLKRDIQMKSIARLKSLGILEVERLGSKRMRHFRIDEQKLTSILIEAQEFHDRIRAKEYKENDLINPILNSEINYECAKECELINQNNIEINTKEKDIKIAESETNSKINTVNNSQNNSILTENLGVDHSAKNDMDSPDHSAKNDMHSVDHSAKSEINKNNKLNNNKNLIKIYTKNSSKKNFIQKFSNNLSSNLTKDNIVSKNIFNKTLDDFLDKNSSISKALKETQKEQTLEKMMKVENLVTETFNDIDNEKAKQKREEMEEQNEFKEFNAKKKTAISKIKQRLASAKKYTEDKDILENLKMYLINNYDAHNFIITGTSWNLMLEELFTTYKEKEQLIKCIKDNTASANRRFYFNKSAFIPPVSKPIETMTKEEYEASRARDENGNLILF